MISVLGVANALARLAAVTGAGRLAAEAAKNEVRSFVADEARGLVAVATGETQESIEETEEGVSVGGAALYLEFGTYKMSAQPFLRPAADAAASHDVSGIARTTLLGGL